MTSNALHAAKACHKLIHDFLKSSSEDPLHSLSLNTTSDNIQDSTILNSHISLNLPTLYPPSFNSILHKESQQQVLQSYTDFLKILNHWNLNQLSISYNGGKDCLVQLIIYLAAIYQHIIENNFNKEISSIHVKAVYVHTENEFDEQIKFLEKSVLQYGLDFTAVYTKISSECNSSQILKENVISLDNTINNNNNNSIGRIKCLFSTSPTLQCGFSTYLESDPSVKAIIVGIRRTDPYGSTLNLEQRTDTHRGWPDFMRINPILEWHTSEIWYFIKWLERDSSNTNFNIDYCSLYNDGYTSLGGCDNTVRNPQLRRKDNFNGNIHYWPAWWILDDDIERLSRVQKGKV
ncbi:hypothetical protein C6P40_001188 [Pichia californica]|uniref:FAD synthase n=1 Tax=Pichia californica TaxID=460514 RepID=A0A9P6WJG3_9ASCO|nr:hypothetical protein C6P42_002301 [[Candida] californica]KAG0688275.1 hypothetical protein C6P40_001188 [[Candida] californica]